MACYRLRIIDLIRRMMRKEKGEIREDLIRI